MKKIILNADDFGLSKHTVEWTIKCFDAGVLSSATIMANMPGTPDAVDFARNHLNFNFGMHLYLSDEVPTSSPKNIPSLVGKDGKLYPTRTFILRCFLGLVDKQDIYREIMAQWTDLTRRGITLGHIDGHGHMHRLPIVMDVLIDIKQRIQCNAIRGCQNLYYTKPFWGTRLYNNWMNHRIGEKFNKNKYFLMTSGKTKNHEWLRDVLRDIPEDGVTEIGVHPGIDEEWRRIDCEYLLSHGAQVMREMNVKIQAMRF